MSSMTGWAIYIDLVASQNPKPNKQKAERNEIKPKQNESWINGMRHDYLAFISVLSYQ